jgi:hypothetical protein
MPPPQTPALIKDLRDHTSCDEMKSRGARLICCPLSDTSPILMHLARGGDVSLASSRAESRGDGARAAQTSGSSLRSVTAGVTDDDEYQPIWTHLDDENGTCPKGEKRPVSIDFSFFSPGSGRLFRNCGATHEGCPPFRTKRDTQSSSRCAGTAPTGDKPSVPRRAGVRGRGRLDPGSTARGFGRPRLALQWLKRTVRCIRSRVGS